MEFPINVQVADNFTTIVTNKDKVYRFYSDSFSADSNSETQQLVSEFDKIGILTRIDSSLNSSYLFNQQRKVYEWGTISKNIE